MEVKSSDGKRYYSVIDGRCNCHAGLLGKECRHIRKAKHPTMEQNTQYIKISSTLNEVSREDFPTLDSEVTIIVQGQVVKQEKKNNQDGTFDLVSVVKPYSISLGNGEE